MHDESILKVRITNVDYSQQVPGPLDRTESIFATLNKVPVLNVFGHTSAGQKACVHIHNVFPYLYIEYKGELDPGSVNKFINRLGRKLNHALTLVLRRNPYVQNTPQHIVAILPVKGVHFYGFHHRRSIFLKIMFSDPRLIRKVQLLLESGAICEKAWQTYESHVDYKLQFMCDFNLYGCNWLEVADCRFREPLPEPPEYDIPVSSIAPHMIPWNSANTPPELMHSVQPIPVRSTRSYNVLELDICAWDILNRHALTARPIASRLAPPFSGAGNPDELFVHSVRELWEDERRRRSAKGMDPTPPRPKDATRTIDPERTRWVASERFWAEVDARIDREKDKIGRVGPDDELKVIPWEAWLMTPFESVEALFPREHQRQRQRRREKQTEAVNAAEDDWSQRGDVENEAEDDAKWAGSQLLQRAVEEAQGVEDEWIQDPERQVEEEEEWESGYDPPPAQPRTPLKSQRTAPVRSRSGTPTKSGKVSPVNGDKGNGHAKRPNLFATPSRDHTPYRSSPLKNGVRTIEQEEREGSIPVLPQNSPDPWITSPEKEMTLKRGVHFDGEERPPKRARIEEADNAVVDPWIVSLDSFTSSEDAAPTCSPVATQRDPTKPLSSSAYTYGFMPPTRVDVMETLYPHKMYTDPHYSNRFDVPERAREYAGRMFKLAWGGRVSEFETTTQIFDMLSDEIVLPTITSAWEFASRAPTHREVENWLADPANMDKELTHAMKRRKQAQSQLDGMTPAKGYGIRATMHRPSEFSTREKQNMSVLAVEIFARSRGRLLPDPAEDEISMVAFAFQDDAGEGGRDTYEVGLILVANPQVDATRLRDLASANVDMVDAESELINKLIDRVLDWDPDVLTGWDVQSSSWSYLAGRAKQYGVDLSDQISRVMSPPSRNGQDRWSLTHTSTFRVSGRHVINVWRHLRKELTLTSYTFENVAFQVLKRRMPLYLASTLTQWFHSPVPLHTAQLIDYLLERTVTVIEILDETELITKTAEFARVFGVEFFSVLERGSQYMVESFMFRIAKPENFVLISPSKEQVGQQNAAECVPLIMEPQSACYKGPLVVLDFQSLYPSIMIAYNYCYSTCLGRVRNFKGKSKFGVTDLSIPPGVLELLKDDITISANGMMFVKDHVRRSLLSKMLSELLDTRVMVKQGMKTAKGDKSLLRLLNARQLSLKYIANVTYGYTSASYSGRMPAVEIADAIVQSGRETLEKAVHLINSTAKWGAKVVYGDTDSLFIYLPGRTKDEAFQIGHDMADTITSLNPAPVKMKFEKVYLPCVLMAKKRYVGFKYENPDDVQPEFDDKGIETVRRDGCALTRKMVEASLRILFNTQDLSEVKEYCRRQWSKILEGRLPIQDFIIAKEVRLGTYIEGAAPPPGAAVAAMKAVKDPQAEAQYGERVPYVIMRGEGRRLVDRAISPEVLLRNRDQRIDPIYYITRQLIPPLERIFNLVGADVQAWYDDMPKKLRANRADSVVVIPRRDKDVKTSKASASTIERHFRSNLCLVCEEQTDSAVCPSCLRDLPTTLYSLNTRMHLGEQRLRDTQQICASCTASPPGEPIRCESLDCEWLYERVKAEEEASAFAEIPKLIEQLCV
ncbi:hypothetical protein DACRYDRAFT_107768 [Dacryopinax primogenitus]|uniref:DNA polymerase n=1 Tax=Dacryopinax primogenitus (strain DJM 731) TaxID=1858805 RepID=M5G1G9_DACPD|nr:uncharacterized protein DACRYDRAFT_107768 [Dacryopinax primogenitus]EJU02050.1 hypothetical protein DACRYDRAFT_107768 [Dacryopinax primogenitus]